LGVIVIAATNRPDVLDPALLRPGRFDRRVMVDLPDVKGRKGIFEVHTKNIPLADDVDLERISRGTPGLSGAEIANITNEAALLAARRDSERVTMMDFEQARDKVLMGVERKSMVISPREKELTAFHEMGHALASKLLPNADPLHKVTIIPRGRALGLTWNFPNEEFHSKSKEYFEDELVVFMAGRAAEKLIFDKETTGASNDLDRASQIARKMVCDWGMSKHIGPVTFRHQQEDVFLGRDISQPKDHSEKTQQEIDDEVRTILLTAMKRAENLLVVNKELLKKGAEILLEREILDADELDVIIRGEELPPISSQKLTALRNINFNITDNKNNSDSAIAENTI
jgi:cell division protease FtsH